MFKKPEKTTSDKIKSKLDKIIKQMAHLQLDLPTLLSDAAGNEGTKSKFGSSMEICSY